MSNKASTAGAVSFNTLEEICYSAMQVAPVQELHAQLSNVAFLDQMHLDRAAQQYRDWGNHTEAVDMQVPSKYQSIGSTVYATVLRG